MVTMAANTMSGWIKTICYLGQGKRVNLDPRYLHSLMANTACGPANVVHAGYPRPCLDTTVLTLNHMTVVGGEVERHRYLSNVFPPSITQPNNGCLSRVLSCRRSAHINKPGTSTGHSSCARHIRYNT